MASSGILARERLGQHPLHAARLLQADEPVLVVQGVDAEAQEQEGQDEAGEQHPGGEQARLADQEHHRQDEDGQHEAEPGVVIHGIDAPVGGVGLDGRFRHGSLRGRATMMPRIGGDG